MQFMLYFFSALRGASSLTSIWTLIGFTEKGIEFFKVYKSIKAAYGELINTFWNNLRTDNWDVNEIISMYCVCLEIFLIGSTGRNFLFYLFYIVIIPARFFPPRI